MSKCMMNELSNKCVLCNVFCAWMTLGGMPSVFFYAATTNVIIYDILVGCCRFVCPRHYCSRRPTYHTDLRLIVHWYPRRHNHIAIGCGPWWIRRIWHDRFGSIIQCNQRAVQSDFFVRLFYFVSLSYKNDINADTRFSHIVGISCVIHVRQMRLILYPKGEWSLLVDYGKVKCFQATVGRGLCRANIFYCKNERLGIRRYCWRGIGFKFRSAANKNGGIRQSIFIRRIRFAVCIDIAPKGVIIEL